MRRFAIFALCFAGGCATTIRGVVRDKPTGNPISAASVSLGDNSSSNALTNALGAYVLRARIRPGAVLLVNAPSYFMYSASVARHNDEGRELERDVELVPRAQLSPR